MNEVERRKYSTTTEDDGVNYRDIAETMTVLGFTMNHSSARNHVVRVMKKFVAAYAIYMYGKDLSDERMIEIAKNPTFQSGVAELLHSIEQQMREERRSKTTQILMHHGFETGGTAEADVGSSPTQEKDDTQEMAGRDWLNDVPGCSAEVPETRSYSSV
jgi:hypothetical protein